MENIGVAVLVFDKKKRILLGKRLNGYGVGLYGLPGGRIDLIEPLDACGKRELLEETNLTAEELTFVASIRELQGDYNFIHFIFSSKKHIGNLKTMEPFKCEKWEWFELDSLPEEMLKGHRTAVQLYQNKESFSDLI
jgi:8-oxo-dGTP diphosphatase